MKKCLLFVIALTFVLSLFAGCSKAEDNSVADSGAQAVSDSVVFCDGYSVENESENGDEVSYYGLIGYDKLAKDTGLKISAVNFFEDQQQLKILAGDSDVDIYFISSSLAGILKKQEIYTVIESEKITKFNSECFDYLDEFTKTESGETVLMPVYLSVSGLAYPEAAAEEAGFDRSDILYYDDMMELVKGYKGERNAYSAGDSFFADMELQYENFYCDFANGKLDYMTDEYKKLYKTLEGWQRYGQSPAPPHFVNPFSAKERANVNKPENVLLIDTTYRYMIETVNDFSGWRAAPMPRMSDKVTANFVNANFAYINPFSKNKEAAVKALEALADNFYDLEGIYPYSILKKDKSVYPQSFRTDTQLFDDFYDIAKDGFMPKLRLFTAHNDIEEYQNGRATLDEAVEMYQREVNIWLNE